MTTANKYRIEQKHKRFTAVYAQMLLNGNIDWVKLGKLWNRFEKIPEARAKRVLRSSFIQNMVTEKLIELTEKHGITAQQSLEYRKKILEEAINKGDLTNANKALDSFDTKLDLQPIKQQQITTTQTDYIKLIDKNNSKQIEAKQIKHLTTTPEQQETSKTNEGLTDND